jgi:hypothetical protein
MPPYSGSSTKHGLDRPREARNGEVVTSGRLLIGITLVCAMVAARLVGPGAAVAQGADGEAPAALESLYKVHAGSQDPRGRGEGHPRLSEVKKAGFIVGAQYGTGTLFQNGRPGPGTTA